MTTRAASVMGALIVVLLALASFALISGQGGEPGPNVTPTAGDLSPSPDDTFIAIESPTPTVGISPTAGVSPTSVLTTSPSPASTLQSSPSPTPAATGTGGTPPTTVEGGTAVTGPPVLSGLVGAIPMLLGAAGIWLSRRR